MALLTKVGSFQRPAGASPVDQAITGVGFVPAVVVVWTVGGVAAGSPRNSARVSVGAANATTIYRQAFASAYATNNAATSATAGMKAQGSLLAVLDDAWTGSGSLPVSAEMLGLNADGFTVRWFGADASPIVVHYLAIGGSGVRATVLSDWAVRNGGGVYAVGGVGFRPDAVLHFWTGSQPGVGVGAVDSYGNQWAIDTLSVDNAAATDAQRLHVTDACVARLNASLAVDMRAVHKSFDPDGFTVDVTTSGTFVVTTVALGGVLARAGFFDKSTAAAPAAQSIPIGFAPKAAILAGVHGTAAAAGVVSARLALGASDGATEGVAAFFDQDAADPTQVTALSLTDKAFVKADISGAVLQAADAAMGTTGIDLSWTPNNNQADRVGYLALGTLDRPLAAQVAGVSDARSTLYLGDGAMGCRAVGQSRVLSTLQKNMFLDAAVVGRSAMAARLVVPAVLGCNPVGTSRAAFGGWTGMALGCAIRGRSRVVADLRSATAMGCAVRGTSAMSARLAARATLGGCVVSGTSAMGARLARSSLDLGCTVRGTSAMAARLAPSSSPLGCAVRGSSAMAASLNAASVPQPRPVAAGSEV